jgi:hypothetical protein
VLEKIKVINNTHGALGFTTNPTPQSLVVLKSHGLFWYLTEDEIRYVFLNQSIIQKGLLWIDDKDMRISLDLEQADGQKVNYNVMKNEEVVAFLSGNYKRLEKVLEEVTEQHTLKQFVENARIMKLDSKAKIDIIEKKANIKVYDD